MILQVFILFNSFIWSNESPQLSISHFTFVFFFGRIDNFLDLFKISKEQKSKIYVPKS